MIKLNVENLKKCKVCQSEMQKVVYGYPPKLLSDIAKENGWIFGGCSVTDIEFLCKVCGSSWSSIFGFSPAT
jgi:transposase-like protein